MDFGGVLLSLSGPFLLLTIFALLLDRAIRKHTGGTGKRRIGFYPSNYALGLALRQIQTFVAPNMEATISDTLKEAAEAGDEGDPADPTIHLNRQLKRIRNGEQIDRLTTILRNDHARDEALVSQGRGLR